MSDVVFEYLSPEELFEILQEFRRIAAPDAVMSHTIDLGDQYATYDFGITKFNFLRFSDRLWRWLNNPIIPLNRLRISDYRRAFSERGFQVGAEISQRGDPAELARTPSRSPVSRLFYRGSYWSLIPGWWRSLSLSSARRAATRQASCSAATLTGSPVSRPETAAMLF